MFKIHVTLKKHVSTQKNILKTITYYLNAHRGKNKALCCLNCKYLGLFFEGVVSTLQLLHLLLGSVVFSHIGPLCGDGLQRTAVTQYFFIKKLE